MVNLSLPDVYSDRPLFDFLMAIKVNDPLYAATQEALLNRIIKTKETVPTVYKFVADYQNHLRLNRATEKVALKSSFMTLNGEPQDKPQSKPAEQQNRAVKPWTKACIYKQIHRFKDCPYFIKKLRAKG